MQVNNNLLQNINLCMRKYFFINRDKLIILWSYLFSAPQNPRKERHFISKASQMHI